ncbi:MAG: DUF1501 domain-containing protein [Bryobacterales bacterium]|nr:DUF1501 domain-containing protein [Bryobacterales bacterium]
MAHDHRAAAVPKGRRSAAGRPEQVDRRNLLWNCGGGLGIIALAHLLGRNGMLADAGPGASTDMNGGLHHKAEARRVVQLFMSGGVSHLDTFDYKPEVVRRHGEKFDPGERVELFQSIAPGPFLKSPWNWKQHGESGHWATDLLPGIASCIDDLTFVHSMVSKSNVHGPATYMQNTGFVLPGFPSMGTWLSYGLGSMNDNLPAFVVLPDNFAFPPNGPSNWSAGFLPAEHQGTMIRVGRDSPIHDLYPPRDAPHAIRPGERESLRVLQQLNRDHLERRGADSQLEARIQSYEMAARLQLSAPEVLDISGESAITRKLYGLDSAVTEDFGTRCLVARRLLERDVRFVQIWSGADNGLPRRNWDSHENLEHDHSLMAAEMDGPVAGLLKDLKSRGLLEDTIVFWTTEFGRMPCSQGSQGRDHNPHAFTSWLAGGGFRPGATYGKSDEWGYKVAEDPVYCYDIHATILHLLGIDHTRLTYRHNGIDRRLTDVHGHVLDRILA